MTPPAKVLIVGGGVFGRKSGTRALNLDKTATLTFPSVHGAIAEQAVSSLADYFGRGFAYDPEPARFVRGHVAHCSCRLCKCCLC